MPISRRNRRGIVWMIVLVLLVSLTPRLLSSILPTSEFNFSFEELKEREAELIALNNSQKNQHNPKSKKVKSYRIPNGKFDPNKLTERDWTDMGLSAKQADVIAKFTSHGISSNEELKRIFVLPEELYDLIKDSTFYPSRESSNKFEKNESDNKVVLIELNSGTSESLQEIPGIGPYFGKKIITYRDILGGYASKDQLMEVYKMDEEKFNAISPYVYVDDKLISKININDVSLDELKKHPYLNYNQANSIINIRQQHGPFEDVSDIMRSKLIDHELFERLKPYLTIE